MTFRERLRHHRLANGLTAKAAASAAGISATSWYAWEAGRKTPKLWRAGDIARALNIPVAALFTDELVVAEVVVSPDTVRAVRAGGRAECRLVAERLAGQLEPLIWAAVTQPKVDTRPGTRAKRRRTRAEVLAGLRQADAMREAKRLRERGPDEGPIQ